VPKKQEYSQAILILLLAAIKIASACHVMNSQVLVELNVNSFIRTAA
jgi:hypothetical protein